MRRIYLLTLFLGLSYVALAQESSCSDGVDNDGDGFIDCFDGDCANNAACDESYIGKDKLCQTPPPGTLNFGMRLGASSADRTSLSYGRMVVGDLDRDGTPEMVTTHNNDKKVFILNGDDLTIKTTINTAGNPEYFDHAIANLDDDNCAEIFIVESEVRRVCDSRGRNCNNVTFYFVTSYDCNGTQLWRTQIYDQPFTIGLADFDHDGQVELYYKNEILDAKTGQILVAGTGDWNTLDSGPVAVDILPDAACGECAGLELVLGGLIYAVDLNPRTAGGGSVGTPVRRFNDLPGLGGIVYFPKYVGFGYVNSMTSIADYNLDGNLDVIMNGATSASATSTTTVFFWDVFNNTFKTFQPKQPNGSSWPHGTGRINLADIDGDGKMNATFVSGARIYALKEDFTLLWQKTITEQTSGFTSTTVFDFNNDNAVEIVYRDEANLYIIDGKTGNAFTTVPCRSRTANDYPIVVDVDADGATEICVSCATNNNADISNNGNTPFGQIRTFKSSLEPWVSARKVWNQYAYFNVNVNDDLTIPQVQQKHHLVFSEDVCGTGENRALNSFLNQSAILDSKGCKTYPSADVAFVANPSLLNVIPPTCPDKDFIVSFSLRNIGDLDLTGNFPITFYSGDPRLAGAVKLSTETIPLSNFQIGDQIDVDSILVSGTGGAFTLFAVLNDNGSTVPTPISLPNSGFDECNFGNNIVSVSVNPQSFQLSTASTDHIQCGAGPSPPNGTLKVFKPEGAVEQTVGYTFYWFDGATAGAPGSADYTGSVRNGVTNGTYTVYARHDAFQCGSDTVQVAVGVQTRNISATVNVDKPYTNCNNPDGQLSVTPDGGQPLSNYTFEWFEGTVFGTSPTLSDSSVLRFTKALTYSVLVTEKSSNCETLESGTVPDLTVTPSVTVATAPANCAPPNSGQATATVGGVTAGYTFYWYDGSTSKPTEDFLGGTYSNITAGNYTVIARDNATGCTSNETVGTVATVTGISVTANITAQQTSCVTPNGAASANVGGSTAGYTFRWFDGNNTTNLISTGAAITGLAAGDYTVQATNNTTGCTDTELVTIVDNILIPTVTPAVAANQVDCFPPDGAVTATAAGSPGPYHYYWFNGNVGTPDTTAANFKGADYTGLAAGFYTVVAVDVNSRCGSARGVIEVLDQTVDPVISTTAIGQTSCDVTSANGQASANVGGVTAGYKFRWFSGADTTAFIVQSPAIANRAAGTYTVKAITLATGCYTTRLVVINDISANPTLTLSKQDNSVCSATIGYTGSVTAAFATNPNVQAGHTFVYQWTRNGVVMPGQTTSTISGLNAGTYAVTVENETLGCISDPVSIVVNDVVDLPALTTSSTASTNCVAGLENGTAAVLTVDGTAVGGTNDYTYQWHTGAGIATPINTGANATADEALLVDVQGGVAFNYTVLVTNVLTGCANTAVVNVADAKVLPELSMIATDNSVCNPALTSPAVQFNGTMTATVDNIVGGLTDYTFVFGGGAGAPGVSPNHNVYSQLNGGISYTATATHTLTGCVSAPASIQVLNNQDIPDLTTSSDGSTNCVAGLEDGQARVLTVDGNPATTTGFTFAWTGALFDVTGNASNNAIQLADIQGGAGQDYTVLVTNQSNGCQNTAVVNVADEKILPALTLAASDNSICDPNLTSPAVAFNGTVTATVSNMIGVLTDYTFVFAGGAGVAGVSPNHNVFNELNGGITYNATTTHTLTGCVSAPASVQVINVLNTPDLTTSSDGSTNCVAGLEDGQARVVTVDGAVATTTGFTFAWTGALFDVTGNATNNAIQLADIQGGAGQDYTVLVTNQSNGCQNTAVVNVADEKILPALTLAATDNSICDPNLTSPAVEFNGTVTATVSNMIGVLTDYTFVFAGGAGVAGVSPNHNVFNELDGGITYNATTTHTLTGCVSAPASIQVLNNHNIPDLTTSSDGSTNCVAGLEDGQARVVTVDGAVATTTGFTFAWTGALFDVTGNATNNAIQLADIQGGAGQDYTVLVTNQSNGCQNTAVVNVADEKILPALTLAATDNAICDPNLTSPAVEFNGTVTATVSNMIGVLTDYTFVFAGGAGAQGLQPNHNVFNELNGGITYNATTTHTLTGCVSAPASIQVLNNQDIPDLITSSDGSTNCIAGLEDGQARVLTVDGNPATTTGFTFAWTGALFDVTGNATNNAIQLADIQGGAGQDYTVLVTNQSNGCQNTAVVNVADEKILPALTLAATDNSICDPNLTSPAVEFNGTVTATVSNMIGVLTDYTFVFAGGVGAQGVSPNHNVFNELNGGITYNATTTHTLTGCVSAPASVQVLNNHNIPDLTTSSDGSTNCVAGLEDGQVRVLTVDANPATTTGFTFAWTGALFDVTGNATNNAIQLADIQGGAGQDYTVLVTNQSNGCQNTAVVNVADEKILPALTLAASDNSICDPNLTSPAVEFNGTVTATVSNMIGVLTDYTFVFAGGVGAQGVSPNHNVFNELNGGITYNATTTHTLTGCVSAPASVQVLNNHNIPDLTTSSDGSTNCIAGLEDGQARVVTVDGAAATTTGFTFAWTGALFDVTGNATNNAIQLADIQGGAGQDYTVLVTNQANGCQNTAVVNVADEKILPALTLAATDNAICDPNLTSPAVEFNGTVTATVSNMIGVLTDYTFVFAGGAGAQGVPPNHNVFNELDGGITYNATTTHTLTGCVSAPASVQVLNNHNIPDLTTSSDGSTNCVAGLEDGQARVVTVDGAFATTTGFTFAWTGALFDVTGNATNNAIQLADIQGGASQNYTVLVTNQSNGCQNTAVVNVADERVLPAITLMPVNNTICDPALTLPAVPYNGNVTATVDNLAGVLTDYNFVFAGGPGSQGASPVHNTFTQLNGGITYTATATHTLTGCVSNVATAFVTNNLTYPVLLTSADASTNCDPSLDNGAAHVTDVDGLTPGVDAAALTAYTYQWYNGNTANPVNIRPGDTSPTVGSTIPGSGLQGGAGSIFTVLVTKNADGCQRNSAVTIPDAKANPVISVSLLKNNTICDPLIGADGSLTAAVTYKGSAQASPLAANWVVTWSNAFVGETVSGLFAGNYTTTVTDTNTGCVSAPDGGTIVDQFDIPVITTAVLNSQTSCDPANPNGQLQGSATNGPVGSTLRYTWHPGIGTAAAAVATANGQAPGSNLLTLANLVTNDYTFFARNEVTGCENTSTILLPQQLTYPAFTGNVTDVTSCVPTNGGIQINFTTISDPNQFTIYYLDEVNFAQTGNPAVIKGAPTYTSSNTPADLTYTGVVGGQGLIPGTYTVLVRDGVTACESNPVTFTVDDNTNKTVTVSATAEASACSAGVGGSIDITVNPVAPYSYEWYEGAPTNNNFEFMNNANLPAFGGGVLQTDEDLNGYNDLDILGVGAGIYTVVVRDATGCGKVFSETVPFLNAPDVDVTLTNSTQCDPLASDASIQVEVTGVGGLVYSVSLFSGHNSTTGVWINGEDDGCNDTNDNDGDGVADNGGDTDCGDGSVNTIFTSTSVALTGASNPLLGDYLVRVYDPAGLGCALEKIVTLEIDPKLPQVTTALTPSTVCAGGIGDGTVEITVNKDPLDPTTPTYQLSVINPANIGGATPQAIPTGLATMVTGTFDAQAYTLTVEDLVSGCTVDKVVNIPSQPATPTAFVVTPTNDELCAPMTGGSALVTTLTPAPLTAYTFEWYRDNALTTPVTATVAGGAPGGELLTSAEVIATNAAFWPLNATNGLGNGNKTFYVRAQKQGGIGDKCYTPIRQVNINDTHSAPELTLTPFSNTSCSATPEGRIEVTASTTSANGAIAGSLYTYSWAPATAGTPDNNVNGGMPYIIAGLDDNTYTVSALNEANGCITQNSTTVLDTKFDIEITDRLVLDQAICPIGGQVDVTEIQIDRTITGEASLTYSAIADLTNEFTYQWFKAPVASPGTFDNTTPLADNVPATINVRSLVAGTGGQQYPAMGNGTYYVIATRTNSATIPGALCSSQPLRVDVADKRVFPTISFAMLGSTACNNEFDGQITVTATSPGFGAATLYNFDWTLNPAGTTITDRMGVASAPIFQSESLGGTVGERIGPGAYGITVTNTVNGCPTTGTVTLQQNTIPVEVVAANATALTHCVAPDGTVAVTTVNVNGAAAAPGDFTFGWTGPGAPFAGVNGANLINGDYFVTATKTAVTAPASGCASTPFKVTVLDDRRYPTISFATLGSTACNNEFDGQITVDAATAGFGAGTLYNYVWTSDPGGAVQITDQSGVVTGAVFQSQALGGPAGERIGPGAYGVTVTNTVNACPTTGAVTLQQNTIPVEVVAANATALTHCVAPDGTVAVTTVNVNGAAAAPGDFTFGWTGPGAPFAGASGANLINGDYFVTATKTAVTAPASGCASTPYKVTVLDDRRYPTISFATLGSTACNNQYDGQITVTSTTTGFAPATLYNFDWNLNPAGTTITDRMGVASAPVFQSESLGGAVGERIGPGAYGVTVTNTVNACPSTGTVTLQQNTIPVEVVAANATALTHCVAPDGTVAVTTVNVNGAAAAPGDFTFGWTGPGAPFAGASGANLINGDYFVTATKTAVTAPASGCASTPFKVTVLDDRRYPTISFATLGSTACNNEFDGQITVDAATAGFGAGTLYNYVWTGDPGGAVQITDQSGVVTGAVFQSQSLGGPAGERIGPGAYGITVTNTVNACPTTGAVTLQQNTIPVEVVAANATALTHCVAPDGTVVVTTVNVNGAAAAPGDFTFGWTGPGAPFAGVNGANLINGDYFVTATKTAVTAPASGCASTPYKVTVLDDRRYPTISFATLGSTACNNQYDGQITVTSTTTGFAPATLYNFDWTLNPAGTTITDRMGVASAPVFQSESLGGAVGERIGPGAYGVTVTNTVNACPSTGTVTLQQNNVPVEILTATANPQQMCTVPGDGSVAVALGDVRVGGGPVVGGITFAWEDDNGNPVGAGTSVLNLTAGFYMVEATRTSGLAPASGCVSPPLMVEVKDERQFPVVNFSTLANTTCNTVFDAQIVVSVVTAGLGNGANYNLGWTSNPGGAVVVTDAANIGSPYTTPATDNIGVGDYTLTVTNVVTQCPTDAAVSVLQNTTPVQIWDLTKIDQTDCVPFNGSITIDTNDPAHVSVLGPYTFAWEKAGLALNPIPDNALTGVDGGVYTVTGTKTSGTGAGCVTNPLSVTLLDQTQRPTVELLSQANFACDPAMANGQLSAIIFEGAAPAPAADFTLQWFAGKNNISGAPIGNTAVLPNQVQGDYTLLAVDNVSPNMGCNNTATLAIDFDETSFSVTVAAANQNLCAPLQNGSVSVTGITEVRNGVSTPGVFANYDFQWFDENGSPHALTPTFTNGVNVLNNVLAGAYHVQVRNALGCISTETAGLVDDLTILPAITLDNFLNPAVCVLPETAGYLQVSADNSLNFGDYTFEWFEGADDTGTMVVPNNATLGNIQYNQPLQYTVRVTNIATNCVNFDTYRFQVDTVEIQVLASAVARTNCLVDDGSLFATTLNGTGALYNYEWYAGPVATGTPVYTTKDIQGAPVGQYTVVAVNPNHSFCISRPYTTRVPDARVLPVVVATQKNPLTYCDPANPNGVAFANVNNEVNGFTFDWFQGSVNGSPLYTGSEVAGLAATTYVVRATDVMTGCENTASIAIDNNPVDVAEPAVVVVSHHTNCLTPDGILSASVDGNTADYLLQWYDGNAVKNQHDETGEFYRDLPEGFYTTTATDIVSGCVSDPVLTEVLPFQELPEFEIKTVPTNCEQDIGEATLVLLNDVLLRDVEWDIDGVMQFGTMLSDLPKGEFTVTATTYQECVTTKTFVILPEVLVFNGISRNNDGQNDIFEIACIQDFPHNNVKIFNRAGTLVYEANGYDNQDVFFDGVSNRGINLLGTDLPDGTYFYIIDKRNGSEPRTGYLELLR